MVDHEIALEEALQRIGGDDHSDDDSEDSISGYDAEEDLPKSYTENGCPSTHYTAPAHRPVSLRQILDDERSVQLFNRFLKDQCISRNFQFWLSCEYYRLIPPNSKTKLLETAKAVYVKYLKSSAPLHVSISENARKYIQVIINVQGNPEPSLFQQAQQEVYQQMEANELRQFLVSDTFADCAQFKPEESSNLEALNTFKPSQYHAGSTTGSDDSTSVTSFASEDAARTVLYIPPVTRSAYTPRNAHSDTENSSRSRHHRQNQFFQHYSRSKRLTQNDFYDVLCDRLTAVNKDRANMKQRAQNLARMSGKSYEEIMALEWYDAPESIKYKFEEDSAHQSNGPLSSSDQISPSSSHHDIVSQISCPLVLGIAAKEIQEAVKELQITRQVRQKRSNMSSSASSYVSVCSDSGIASESLLSSSRGEGGALPRPTGRRVQDYVQTQNTLTSQLSERDQQAQLAATLLMNNSVPEDEINPTYGSSRRYGNYPHLGGSATDDSSSCFTGTSMSSSSEFFVPRRPHQPYFPESEESRHNRYPPGRRTKRSQPPHPRFIQNPVSHTSTRAMSPAILSNPPPPPATVAMQQPQQQAPTQTVSSTAGGAGAPPTSSTLLVAYTMDGKANMIGKRINNSSLTLGDFKERVFARTGNYRFFFKMFCEEMGSDMMEEISDDAQVLPFYQGKIVGHVELAD